ncbi:creatininase family protein [Conexibacter arvalis]|uniref:Creatinine amidohydrolase n=1 Tax=Conexibacter arvalis TaxID=912552 RepID=A0A840IFA5_9ACTN|nr:creatininase family protein [Conexibacter arvalis]MBB4663005.1 creatinine amidohydrolase [Conexibacter arvalis]
MSALSALTWQQARDALARARVALVPVGSCEQHGPHMTLDSDLAIATGFATRLAERLGDDAVVCPGLAYGMSEHHLAFPGTLTLRAETLLAVVRDLVESLEHWGVRRVLLVNGHGGNLDALRLAAREAVRDRPETLVATVMWSVLAADAIAQRAVGPRYGHACEIETSVALAVAPQAVLPERIAAPAPAPEAAPPSEPQESRWDLPVPFDSWTADGALGDPRQASRELGEEIVAVALERAAALARQLMQDKGDDRR